MIFRKKKGDPDDRQIFGTHPGDLGILLVAAIITVAFFALLLTPRNFGAFYKALEAPPPPPPAPRAEPVTPGVTPMQIYKDPDKKK